MIIRKRVPVLVVLLAAFLAVATQAFAANITIWDGMTAESYNPDGSFRADGKVTPGCVNSQVWDLEGFTQNGNQLTMVGGFDYRNGVAGYPAYGSGDIFIAAGVVPVYGNPAGTGTNGGLDQQQDVANSFKYNYVFRFDSAVNGYTAYRIDGSSIVTTVFYNQNAGANPWRFVPGSETVLGTGSLNYTAGLTDAQTGFTGGTHYAVTVDLGLLGLDPGTSFYAHYTMGCGNDTLMGRGTAPVPEPGTMILLGSGLVGLAGLAEAVPQVAFSPLQK